MSHSPSYLKALADEEDWEALPRFLQDAVDSLLIDEVRHEKAEAVAVRSIEGSDCALRASTSTDGSLGHSARDL